MGIVFGLLSAVCWGTSDFLASAMARRIGVVPTLFYTQIPGILFFVALFWARGLLPAAPLTIWVMAVFLSMINALGGVLIYRSFAIGTVAMVAPITSGAAVVTVGLAVLSGERPGLMVLVGGLLAIAGVLFVSTVPRGKQRISLAGVPEALGVTICFGLYFWAVGFITPDLGLLWPVLLVRLADLVFAFSLLSFFRIPLVRLPLLLWGGVLGISLLNTTAFLSYNAGVSSDATSLVAALASLASAVTVGLAALLLRERLAWWQWIGAAGIMCGVALVSLFRG
jgi:drug/metabolite transporter (DMT)-like permease